MFVLFGPAAVDSQGRPGAVPGRTALPAPGGVVPDPRRARTPDSEPRPRQIGQTARSHRQRTAAPWDLPDRPRHRGQTASHRQVSPSCVAPTGTIRWAPGRVAPDLLVYLLIADEELDHLGVAVEVHQRVPGLLGTHAAVGLVVVPRMWIRRVDPGPGEDLPYRRGRTRRRMSRRVAGRPECLARTWLPTDGAAGHDVGATPCPG